MLSLGNKPAIIIDDHPPAIPNRPEIIGIETGHFNARQRFDGVHEQRMDLHDGQPPPKNQDTQQAAEYT
ncbi:hypothetical protein MSSD14B_16580 [Marinobacter salsuginis]|uniref:Uncharacterized protein n=1 Tax=Marinobacter salsuginis TaxID=418719 RepID=A0A5M3PYL8_9GAMM|nr:hypothetical protein MSSD14B_16580 [Marinobacter salsuginis]